MNILIISLARCGSTSLQKSIASYYKSKIIFEPYSAWGLQRKKYKIDNVVVKTIFHQIDNKEYTFNTLNTLEYTLCKYNDTHYHKCLEFYLNLIKKFDNVILLSRDNIKEHAESLISLYNGVPFNEKYVYNHSENFETLVEQIKLENKYLKKLSELACIPIDTYESIYYGNGLINKTIQLDYTFIDNKLRLRQFENNIKKSLL